MLHTYVRFGPVHYDILYTDADSNFRNSVPECNATLPLQLEHLSPNDQKVHPQEQPVDHNSDKVPQLVFLYHRDSLAADHAVAVSPGAQRQASEEVHTPDFRRAESGFGPGQHWEVRDYLGVEHCSRVPTWLQAVLATGDTWVGQN